MSKPYMKPPLFWLCWAIALAFDWIPGYCRWYSVERQPTAVDWVPLFKDMKPHWEWQWRGEWGFRLLVKLGLIDDFVDECQRRFEERNPSSAS